MIPSQLKTLIEQQPGDRIRTDRAAAERALAELGVSPDSEFAQLYLAYKLLSFRSEVSYEELVDVAEPNHAVAVGTRFAHEFGDCPTNTWRLPRLRVRVLIFMTGRPGRSGISSLRPERLFWPGDSNQSGTAFLSLWSGT